jgi:hypothetical protein
VGEIEEPDFSGSDEFVVSLQGTLDSDASHQETPNVQRRPSSRPLTQIAEAHGRGDLRCLCQRWLQFEGDRGSFLVALLSSEPQCETATIDKKQDLTSSLDPHRCDPYRQAEGALSAASRSKVSIGAGFIYPYAIFVHGIAKLKCPTSAPRFSELRLAAAEFKLYAS